MTHDYLTFEEGIDVLLERLDGAVYSFKECGIGVRDFAVSSPYYATEYENIDGMDGVVDTGTTLGYRQIKMSLYFVADSMEDYAIKRHEVFSILDSRQAFYITESRNPHKRWKVKIDGIFTPDQARLFGFFDVSLTSASPYALSPGTTLNMLPDDHYYSIGDGKIDEGDPLVQFEFDTSSFFVFNDSDTIVDPRNMQINIKLQGTLVNPIIRNLTTSDEWKWTGSATASDVISLDGVRSLKNDQSIFGQTNKQLITLARGWNEFSITGATDFTIAFDFKMYYL